MMCAQMRMGLTCADAEGCVRWQRQFLFARDRKGCQVCFGCLGAELVALGFKFRVENEPCANIEVIGLRFDLCASRVFNRALRAWRFRWATLALAAQGRCYGDVLGVWVGHVHLIGLQRCAYSALESCYQFRGRLKAGVGDFDVFSKLFSACLLGSRWL